VSRPPLGPVSALIALVLALSTLVSAGGTATANRVLPSPDKPSFSKAEAKDVLAKAERQLRRGTKRPGKPVGNGADTEITMTLRDLYLARTKLRGEDRQAANEMSPSLR